MRSSRTALILVLSFSGMQTYSQDMDWVYREVERTGVVPPIEEGSFDYTPRRSYAPADPTFSQKACEVLYGNLERPRLRSEKITIGHYTDIFTLPQTKTECTNVYDTGVPDLSTCTTEWDECADKLEVLGGWTCVPGTTTRCTNIKMCNTWANYKKTMECDLTFQVKLPRFVEVPVQEFLDNSYQTIEATRAKLGSVLPLECAPANIRDSADPSQRLAEAVTAEIQQRLRTVLEREARKWAEETAIATIGASIPSGGIGGAAAMSTSIANFIYRAHTAVKPILTFANEAKDFAEDLGFSTSCGWNEWHRW